MTALQQLFNTTILVGLAVSIAGSGVGLAATPQATPSCSTTLHRAFDSRLDAEPLARVPIDSDAVKGFEIVDGRPVIALAHRLIGIEEGRPVAFPSVDTIDALSVDAAGQLWVQHGARVRRLTKEGWKAVPDVEGSARLYNSGNGLFLQTLSQGARTRMTILTGDNSAALPPIEIEGGRLVAASWNQVGFAGVMGDSLLTWTAGGRDLKRVYSDKGLQKARDVALIGPDRAVVALASTLMLVSDRSVLMLAAMRARVRWAGDALYVLDETTGVVWKLSGLGAVGRREADRAHAAKLVKTLTAKAPDTDPAFLEAARIVGCEGARVLRKK